MEIRDTAGWKPALRERHSSGGPRRRSADFQSAGCTRLGASADWKSAIQQARSLRYAFQLEKLHKTSGSVSGRETRIPRACRLRPQFQQPEAELVRGQDVFAVLEELQGLLELDWIIRSQWREVLPSCHRPTPFARMAGQSRTIRCEKNGPFGRLDWLEMPGFRQIGRAGLVSVAQGPQAERRRSLRRSKRASRYSESFTARVVGVRQLRPR